MSKLPLLVSLVLSAAALGACDSKDPAPATSPKPAATAPTGPVAHGAETATGSAASAKSPAETKKTKRPTHAVKRQLPSVDAAKAKKQALAFSEAYNKGRKASAKDDFGGAVLAFDEALAIKPNHAGALGEKGWVMFKWDRLDEARRATAQAVRFVKSDRRKGALLYNLGRINEKEGELEAAVDNYERSLAARPNDTVQARLDKLRGKPGKGPIRKFETLDALCDELLVEELGCDIEDEFMPCACEVADAAKSPRKGSHIGEAAVISLYEEAERMQSRDMALLALKTQTRGWHVVATVAVGQFLGGGSYEADYEPLSLEFKQIVAGDARELVLVMQQRESETDYDENVEMYGFTNTMWICQTKDSSSTCSGFDIAEESRREKFDEDGPNPDPDAWGPIGTTKWELEFSFSDDAVQLSPKAGSAAPDEAGVVGTHKISELPGKKFVENAKVH